MNQFTQRGVAVLALIILLVGAVYVWKRDQVTSVTTDIATSTDILVATSAPATNPARPLAPSTPATGAVTVGAREDIIGQPVATPGVAAPSFKNPVTCTLAADACVQVRAQQADIISTLTANKTDFESWITLGTLYKMNGDYKNAAIMWEYVSAIYPKNITSFANLGDLYTNFLKDYPKAVVAYTQEIKNSPANLDAYKSLFQIYTTTSYTGEAGAAEKILKEGIVANPKATELHITLARYYRSLGRSADAKAQYAAAIESAQSQGQTTLVAEIKKESDAM
jgi:hypothetical protein